MSRTPQHPVAPPHPDVARIAGLSAALVFNAALLLMLLRPIELPLQSASTEPTPFWWIDPVKPKPVQRVPVVQPRHIVQQPVQAMPRVQPAAVITPDRTPMSTQATITPPAIDLTPPPTAGKVDPEPIEASLAYREVSPPPYPRAALRDGIEGTVQLRVLVDETGHVLDVQVERSSGDRQLDSAAREHVLHRWLFQPAQRNGVAMRAWGRVPIVFRLDDR